MLYLLRKGKVGSRLWVAAVGLVTFGRGSGTHLTRTCGTSGATNVRDQHQNCGRRDLGRRRDLKGVTSVRRQTRFAERYKHNMMI